MPTLILIALLFMVLSGCSTTETWIPPAGKSELQAKRDQAECERYVTKTSATDINTCMESLGYKKQAQNR
jgi:hypothetical protein